MKKSLLVSGLILLFLFLVLLITQTKSPGRCLTAFKSVFISYSYLDNPNYLTRTEYFSSDTAQKSIVMLGNSLTSRMDWNKLLNRHDVANRGIGSDITEGFVNRMNTVVGLKPQICFVEGGVNDLARNIPVDEIIKNLRFIINTLKSESIIPVLTTVTYVSRDYRKSGFFNRKVKRLNKALLFLAKQSHVYVIDLNPSLTDGRYLKKEHAEADGIHLKPDSYLIWRDEIINVLVQQDI